MIRHALVKGSSIFKEAASIRKEELMSEATLKDRLNETASMIRPQ